MSTVRTIRIDRARRMAIAAQGLARPRPVGRVDAGHLRRVLDRMTLVQLDSVNVLTRSHHLPFFSRLGPYDRDRLDDLLWRSGECFEYIAHEAAVLPVDLHPFVRYRMASHRSWRTANRLNTAHPGYLDAVLAEVAEHGPLTATDLSNGGDRTGDWWGLSPGKWALAGLHAIGRVAVADRRTNFVIAYDLPERVIPGEVLERPPPSEHESRVELVRRAVRALGVATLADIADYHRQTQAPTKAALVDLVRAGAVEEVRVEGWREAAFVDPALVVPRRSEARALLSPFDPLVWFRPRAERLFDFHYRIEIYTPAPKRRFGYYVLPFLLGDRLVGRVDLKADRAAGVLRVRAAHVEDHADPHEVSGPLAAELSDMARWLDVPEVAVEPRGELASALAVAIRGGHGASAVG